MLEVNNCKLELTSKQMSLLKSYAKRLEADTMIIEEDGSLTLLQDGNYICEGYHPWFTIFEI